MLDLVLFQMYTFVLPIPFDVLLLLRRVVPAPVGPTTAFLFYLQKSVDEVGEESFGRVSMLSAVSPVVYFVYFDDPVSHLHGFLKFRRTPGPRQTSLFIGTGA